MKVISIKNVIIGALVAVNLVFLAVFLSGLHHDGAVKAQALRDLAELCFRQGISLDTQNVRSGGVLQEFTSTRSETAEMKTADILLGNTTRTDKGGNTFEYAGEKGRASFRSGGKFDASLNPGAYPEGDGPLKTAKTLLKALGIDVYSITDSGGGQLTAVCALNRQPVFNCTVGLTFRNGSLVEISGKLPGALQATAYRSDMSSAATAVMRFLRDIKGDVKQETYHCTQIRSVTPGYLLAETTIPGSGTMKPVWRIETDTGSYAVDTVTGKIEKT